MDIRGGLDNRVSLFVVLVLSIVSGSRPTTIGNDHATVLVEAARRGDVEAIRQLLLQQVDVNMSEPDGTTALHWAAHRDESHIAELLIRAGANVRATTRYGVTPLALACENGSAAIIERLLKAGADPNASLPGGETALMTVARAGDVGAVKVLLARGADVNAREATRGQTALMWAAAVGNTAAIQALLTSGADVRARGFRPSGDFVGAGSPEERRAKATTLVTGRPNNTFTPLLFAVLEGHIDAVRALLDGGADANDRTEEGVTALALAIINTHFELAAYLLERGADPNASDALHELVQARSRPAPTIILPTPTGRLSSLDLAQKMIATGANVNGRSKSGLTPALLAARYFDTSMLRLLSANGADLKARTPAGTTALMWAAGVDGNGGDEFGEAEDITQTVRLLLELGGDVNAANDKGETALIGAAWRGVPPVVQRLIEAGAALDAKTKQSYRFGPAQPVIKGEEEPPDGRYGCTALAMAISTPNCRPVTTKSAHPEAEAIIRRAMRERDLSEYVDDKAWWIKSAAGNR
jgi:ankyrin repeat protein